MSSESRRRGRPVKYAEALVKTSIALPRKLVEALAADAVRSGFNHWKVRIYFSLLFLLGCRPTELRTCSWAQLDLEAAIWHKLTTKNGTRQVLPLSPEAVALFKELPNRGPYCFEGATPQQAWSRTAVKYWWLKIRHITACPDVQIRDLRRSTASWLTMHGENLKVVQSILDHSSLSTTQIYARLDIGSIREALQRHARRLFPIRPKT